MTIGHVVAIAQSTSSECSPTRRSPTSATCSSVSWPAEPPGRAPCSSTSWSTAFTTAGAFGVITLCERARDEAVEVADYAGLARRHPLLAAALGLFLLSLVGIPPLAGFVGKFYVFGAAVRAGYVWLAVIGVLNSAVAAYYYLRVGRLHVHARAGGAATALRALAGRRAGAGGGAGRLSCSSASCRRPSPNLAQAAVAPLVR